MDKKYLDSYNNVIEALGTLVITLNERNLLTTELMHKMVTLEEVVKDMDLTARRNFQSINK